MFNDSEAINLTFGLTLQQIIDVVSHHNPPHPHSSHYHPPDPVTPYPGDPESYPESDLESCDLHPRPRDPHPGPLLPPLMKCRQAFPSKLQRHRASCKIGQRRQRGLFPTVSLFNGHYCCRYFSDPISQYFTRVDNTEWNKRQPGGPTFRPG